MYVVLSENNTIIKWASTLCEKPTSLVYVDVSHLSQETLVFLFQTQSEWSYKDGEFIHYDGYTLTNRPVSNGKNCDGLDDVERYN